MRSMKRGPRRPARMVGVHAVVTGAAEAEARKAATDAAAEATKAATDAEAGADVLAVSASEALVVW